MKCIKCGSTNLVKNAFNRLGNQIYLCKDCGRRGTMSGNKGGPPKNNSSCELCDRKVVAKGLCSYHYYTFKRKP